MLDQPWASHLCRVPKEVLQMLLNFTRRTVCTAAQALARHWRPRMTCIYAIRSLQLGADPTPNRFTSRARTRRDVEIHSCIASSAYHMLHMGQRRKKTSQASLRQPHPCALPRSHTSRQHEFKGKEMLSQHDLDLRCVLAH